MHQDYGHVFAKIALMFALLGAALLHSVPYLQAISVVVAIAAGGVSIWKNLRK
jgi:hypothetical protein